MVVGWPAANSKVQMFRSRHRLAVKPTGLPSTVTEAAGRSKVQIEK